MTAIDPGEAAAAATAGDKVAFASLTDRYRRPLHVHCYRIWPPKRPRTGAGDLSAGLARPGQLRRRFPGPGWPYRIATNVCLDIVKRSSRRLVTMHSFAEVPWLQPYPDRVLGEVAERADEPDAVAVERETIELTFVAAMPALPPRQRAVLILRAVLGWPATETARFLDTSPGAVNSALQRARATMQGHLPPRRADWDAAAILAISAPDIRVTMPPNPVCFQGLDGMSPLMERAFGEHRDGDWRLVPTGANRMPTAATYLRRPGDSEFRGFKLDVLRIDDGVISEITTFGPAMFPAFGLPPTRRDPDGPPVTRAAPRRDVTGPVS